MSTVAAVDIRPLFIPPVGLRFRLIRKATSQVLYAYRDGGVDGVLKSGVTEMEPVNGNQFWKLIPAGAGFSGQYLIASDIDDRFAMYADSSNSPWYLSNRLSSCGSFFAFRQVSANEGWFRIHNPSCSIKCVMNTRDYSTLRTVVADCTNYDDQVFRFDVDDLDIVGPIQYHLLSASIISKQKVELASETVNNNGSIEQSQSLFCSRAKSHFRSLDYASGTTISVDMTFEVGIPFVTNGKIGVAVSPTQTWHWGKIVTSPPTIEWNISISTPPHRQYRFTRYITEGQLSIPYTITLKSKKFDSTVTSSGVATAVATWDSYTDIQDIGPAISKVNDIDENVEGGGDNRTGAGKGED